MELSGLKKRYVGPDGSVVPVIDIDRFTLASGEQVALVGSSGSGKTTLLHLIAGILTPDSGRILFGEPAGVPQAALAAATLEYQSTTPPVASDTSRRASTIDVCALPEAERDIFRGKQVGYVFQTHHLLPGFTAMENVLLGMSFTGRRADPAWAKHLLEEVGLSQRLDYKPEKLSVGQQQRVAVARALANRPSLVLADEPTGALDPASAQQVLELIRKLCTEVKASLLLVSHDPQITQQLERVVSLKDLNKASK